MFSNSHVFETGLFDFHKLTFTVLKHYFQKQKPKVIKYRNYKKIDNKQFRNDLLNELLSKNVQIKHLDSFESTAQYVFDRHAPLKEKQVRCNQATFVNKDLRKAIMTRSRLLNRFRHDRTIPSHVAYKKQRNICVKLLRKTKKYFFNNLDVKCVTDNKKFWKTVTPCLTDKALKGQIIKLIESEKVKSNETELVKIFNEYFSNIAPNLDIQRSPSTTLHHDPKLNAIKKFENHPSILQIKKNRFCSV